MQRLLGDLKFVRAYLDDICVFSPDFKTHMEHLLIVFDRLVNANVKLNWKKCRFFQQKIEILGHVIEHNKIMMNPKKIDTIQQLKKPTTTKELHRIIGLFSYYRRYIKDFAAIAQPLYKLLQKSDKSFVQLWSNDQDNAFEKLKMHLISYPILRPPDFRKQFFLFTDASSYAIGCVLSQTDNKNEY